MGLFLQSQLWSGFPSMSLSSGHFQTSSTMYTFVYRRLKGHDTPIETIDIHKMTNAVNVTSDAMYRIGFKRLTSPSVGTCRVSPCDNIFIERLWRSVKYEEVYLNDYESVTTASRRNCRDYFNFYNQRIDDVNNRSIIRTSYEVHFQ